MMPSFRVNKIRGYTSISIINRYSLQQTTSQLQRIDNFSSYQRLIRQNEMYRFGRRIDNFSSYQRGMQYASNHPAICVILQREIILKMYLIENKEVTSLYKLNR